MPNPELRDITRSKYLSAWTTTSFAGVISELGDEDPWILRINKTPTCAANVNIPNNISLEWEGDSLLNINSGVIVNGPPPQDHPNRLLFTGPGQYRIAKHPAYKYVDGVWYLGDGTAGSVTITPAMSEAMRYGPFNNNGGYVLLPIGTYEIDHNWLVQRGGIVGSANDPNGHGTIIRRIAGGSGQPAAFTFLEGARTMYIRQIGIENDESDGCGMLAYSAAASPQTIDGLRIENTTVYGGSHGFRVHHDHANKNWQVHNIFIDRDVNFLDQTTACLRCNAINSGGTFYPKVRPAAGARGMLLEAAAKWEWGGDGAGILPESIAGSPPAAVKFTFTSSDVNTSTNAITAADGDDLQTGDSVYFTTTGTLPAPLALNTRYNWNAANKTLHTNPANAASPSEAIDLTDGGSGTHTLWSTRPHPDAVAGQPAALIEIAGPMQEGFVGLPMARDEGFHTFMKVTSAVGTERALPINLFGVHSQGQFDIQGSVDIDLFGGVYRAEAFKDVAGVSARIRNFGARIWTYGVGGPTNNYGGYTVADPWFDDFKGGSAFLDDHRPGGPSYHGVYGNDAPMWGLRVFNNNTANKLRMWAIRIGSGVKAGWTGFRNWASGVADSQSGYDFDGGISRKGRLMNSRTPDAATGTSGTITLDLQLNDVFTVTPTGNATIEVSNGPAGHQMDVTLIILTSGTSSYDLSQGTLSVMQGGAFATGTTSGALYLLRFRWNGTYLIEDRMKAQRLAPVATADVVHMRGASNAIHFYDRATDGGTVIAYSAAVGAWALYHGGSDFFKVDQSTTARDTRLLIWDVDNGALERVTVGDPDSGGSGFKVLRIPN